MKIKTTELSYDEAMALPGREHKNPTPPSAFFRWLVRTISAGELKAVGFTFEKHRMELLQKGAPCLVLMNHSSFIDLKIAETVMKDHPMNIICTSDGMVGKEWLMRKIGCIPTNKFVTDVTMVKDMHYALHKLGCSVLMYPEASYSFDGTATPLPDSIGKCIKMLKVPVVMIRTHGAFLRDPLYNNLQLRNVPVTADVTLLLTAEEVAEKTPPQLQEILTEAFTFDNFKEQQEQSLRVTEPFRADYLNRVLYKCPHCHTEGKMVGKGIHITCNACGKGYELTETGHLKALSGESLFSHIPDWFKWQREEVCREIQEELYHLQEEVEIYLLKDLKSIYHIGDGLLTHNKDGFHLTGCDGKLDYSQNPKSSYSLYSDYYWYEIGDMICIGDMKHLYYCFPKNKEIDIAAKTRIAVEELYKMATGK